MIKRTLLLTFIALVTRPCVAAENLIAFVGEKISLEEFAQERAPLRIITDAGFKAQYRVLDVVYGKYTGETIAFEAYDHYGRPAFEKHRYVLLFVSESEGQYFHQKYQYFPCSAPHPAHGPAADHRMRANPTCITAS